MAGELLDANVWLAAVFPRHPAHAVARRRIEEATPARPAVFCRAVQLTVLRLLTNRAILATYGADGLANRDASRVVESLIRMTGVREREEPSGLAALWHRLAARETASPKVWMDAYLAAFALRGGLSLATLDRDFRSYERHGLEVVLLEVGRGG